LRRLLLAPPYGDPTMSVNLVLPPESAAGEAGFLVMEAMGYPAFSGSNAICTATALLESGRLPMPAGERRLVLDCPAGPVTLTAVCHNGRVAAVTYDAGLSFVAARALPFDLPGQGRLLCDLVWSGVFYALVRLESLEGVDLATLGAAVVAAAPPDLPLRHPELGPMGPLSFVHFAGPLEKLAAGRFRSRTASYVHPGVVCASPTGTGTSARLACHGLVGDMEPGDVLETVSPSGACFTGRLVARADGGVRSAITGRAQPIGRGDILIDHDDPLVRAAGPMPSFQ